VIPICLGGQLERLGDYVVPGDLPLLLSRPALRAAMAVLDLVCDSRWLKNRRVMVTLRVDATGHLLVNLLPLPVSSALVALMRSRSRHVSFSPAPPAEVSVSDVAADNPAAAAGTPTVVDAVPDAAAGAASAGASSSPFAHSSAPALSAGGVARHVAAAPGGAYCAPSRLSPRDARAVLSAGVHLPAVLYQLHRPYANLGAARLLHLLRDAGCSDAAIAPALRRVTEVSAVCRASSSRPPRAVVTLTRPTAFNDTVAVDLAEVTGRGRFLHMIDLGTRLSRCVVVADKKAPTIVRTLLSVWICVYEAMR